MEFIIIKDVITRKSNIHSVFLVTENRIQIIFVEEGCVEGKNILIQYDHAHEAKTDFEKISKQLIDA